jgi:hypothetical protein
VELKRHYEPNALAAYKAAQAIATAAGQPEPPLPPVTHVSVRHTGHSAEQRFSDRLVDKGKREGWITASIDALAIKTDDGAPDLQYKVTRRPGYFVKSSGAPIPISPEAWARFRWGGDSSESRPEALAWLAKHGLQPDDYDITTQWHCVLDDALHAKYRLVPGPKGMPVPAHTLEG